MILIVIAAFLAGALNAVAGGGSFLTLPAMIFGGMPAVIANATSTVALLPGSFASAFSYRKGVTSVEGISLRTLIGVSLAGGIAGAILLLVTPESIFVGLMPWLLLFATGMFAFGKDIGMALKRYIHFGFGALLVSQIAIAIYGGYFGGGIGIMMLAALAIYGMTDINAMNGIKTILAGCLNGVAAAVFVIKGIVAWREALWMMAAAILGGYFGAHFAQKIPGKYIRVFVIATGVLMSGYLFVHAYG